jgi:uncharacterized repeat protein (TIGR01451 family)
MFKRAFLAVTMSVCALLTLPLMASAATPAGSIIRNQAEATYFDPATDRSYAVTSTIATVRVRSAPDFSLLNDNDVEVSPDETVTFPHLLTNTGNETDRYNLSWQSVDNSPLLEGTAIYHDLNENGALDAGEPQIVITNNLAPGQSIALLVVGRVPALAAAGSVFTLDIQAISDLNPDNIRTRRDIARINVVTPFRINKSAFPACSTPIRPGSDIEYDIDLLNLDQLRGDARDYTISGTTRRGFVIEDTIPANTTLVAGQSLPLAPQRSEILVRRAGASDRVFEAYTQYNERDLIQSVAVFIPETQLLAGQSGRFVFKVRVNDTITPGTVISNAVSVDIDGDGRSDTVSNQTCNTVDPEGVQASLRFLEPTQTIRTALSTGTDTAGPQHPIDGDYVDAPVYRLDTFPAYLLARDGVYLEVRSNALNTSGFVSEDVYGNSFIRVRVQSADTGDTLFVRLLETAPNSGLFRAEIPFRLSANESGQGRDCGPAVREQCVLRSVSGDRLQATIFDPGTETQLEDLAVVDPLGIVFDSTSLRPVTDAIVVLRTPSGAIATDPDTGGPIAAQTTTSDGRYIIPRLENGLYYVDVTAPQDYTFPSIVPAGAFAGRREVDDRSYGLNGYLDASSGLFASDFANTPPVIDVPLDPDLTLGQLSLEKEASRQTVTFGDTLIYTLTTRNGTEAVLLDVKVTDAPPAGFRFVEGSATLNGDPLEAVRGPTPRALTFPVERLEVGETAVITYRLQVGPEARPGDQTNVAVTTGRTGGGVLARSPRASEIVQMREDGLLSDRAYLIGSVWADGDGDGQRDVDEVGLPGARIWLEDGTWVETDELGRYSLYGLKPGLRIARIDPETLPVGYEPTRTTNRQIGKGEMRFVDLIAGGLHRGDFPLACPEETYCGRESAFAQMAGERAARQSPNAMLDQALAYDGLIGETVSRDLTRLREQPGPDGDISNGVLTVAGAPGVRATDAARLLDANLDAQAQQGPMSPAVGPTDPETAAATLGRIDVKSGEWLWPLADAQTKVVYARDGRFMAAIRAGLHPTLYVDGVAVSNDSLGAVIENRERGAAVAAWYGVNMEPGRHTLEVRGEDQFGNERVLARTDVIRPGKAVSLWLEPPVEKTAADGRTQAQITLRSLDKLGVPSTGTQFITLNAEIPGSDTVLRFAGQDVQPSEPGFQIRLRDGSAVIGLVAPETPGEVVITATDGGQLNGKTRMRFNAPMRDLMGVGILELNGRKFDVSGALEPADADLYPESWETDGRAAVFLKGRIKGEALLTFAYDSEASRNDGLFRDIDPEAYYPIYGDSSEKGFEAQSRSKLYVRIEKGDSSVMWGDYRTDAYSEETLTRTRRALTGVNAITRQGDWTFQGFAAEASKSQRTERIRGRGTALDLVLPGAPLVPNAEVLTIEVRDRDNPGLVISETSLELYVDYLLDDDTGRLVMKAPIPSIDSEGNPVFLLATYEVEGEEADSLVAGLRATRENENGRLWAGATLDEAQNDVERRVYGSVGGERYFENGSAYIEVAKMETRLLDGTADGGEALRIGVEAQVLGGLATVEMAQADASYENVDSPILAGRREARAEYIADIGAQSAIKVGGAYSEDLRSGDTRSTAQALGVMRVDDWTVTAGPRYTRDEGGAVESDFLSGVLRLDRALDVFGRPASTHLEIERALDENRTRLQVGGDLVVRDDTRLYASHRILDELPEQTFAQGLTQDQQGIGRQKTIFGIESSILPGTDLYGEFREGGALDSRTGEAAYGVRAQWEIMEGLSIAPHLEIIDTFDNGVEDTTDGTPALATSLDSTALSFAIADRRDENARRTARIETRLTDQSTFYAVRAGWAQRFSPTFSGAVKVDAARDNINDSDDLERVRTTFGLARRPGDAEKADWFSLYQWYTELEGGDRRTAHIVSTHANREFGDDWTLSGRAVAKWEQASGYNGSAQLLGARVIRNVHKDWDVEANLAVRSVGWGDAQEDSYGVAASWQPKDNLRLTFGYNWAGFDDRDLDPSGYNAEGMYWRIAVAVDEDWFSWLRPDGRERVVSTPPALAMKAPAPRGVPKVYAPQAEIAKSVKKPLERVVESLQQTALVPPIVEPVCNGARSINVYFGLNSAKLQATALNKISQAVQLAKCSDALLSVIAHTDRSGSAGYNQLLSQQRAYAVVEALEANGVSAETIQADAQGELNPPIPTLDGVSEAKNRVAKVTVLLK